MTSGMAFAIAMYVSFGSLTAMLWMLSDECSDSFLQAALITAFWPIVCVKMICKLFW